MSACDILAQFWRSRMRVPLRQVGEDERHVSAFRVRQHGAHAFGQMGGDGKGRLIAVLPYFWVGMISARHQRLGIAHRFQPWARFHRQKQMCHRAQARSKNILPSRPKYARRLTVAYLFQRAVVRANIGASTIVPTFMR